MQPRASNPSPSMCSNGCRYGAGTGCPQDMGPWALAGACEQWAVFCAGNMGLEVGEIDGRAPVVCSRRDCVAKSLALASECLKHGLWLKECTLRASHSYVPMP